MDIEDFFNKAYKEKTIAENNKVNTFEMLFQADKLLKEEINKKDSKIGSKLKDGKINRHCISSVTIAETFKGKIYQRPVIDLVQQGGGMYGIALLGYTYVMEKVGIRFYSHGGTSAGAINAMFLAGLPNSIYEQESPFSTPEEHRQTTKSEVLTHIIANTDFSKFMEKSGFIGTIQRQLFKNYKALWLRLLCLILVLSFLVGIYALFGLIFNISVGLTGSDLRTYDFLIGTMNIGAFIILVYILLVKLLKSSFGINTGEEFYNWADKLLGLLQIDDTSQLNDRLKENKLYKETKGTCRLVLITANLTHNRIVKFPEKAGFYWTDPDRIKPAAYLRATMSLPFIYYTFIPNKKHYNTNVPKDPVLLEARFVDGGMLSNFPIREFHRIDNKNPRFPTFGVLLSKRVLKKAEELTPEEIEKKKLKVKDEFDNVKLVSYIMSFFSTFRNFYDNEYLFRNEEIETRIETVQTEGFNWLNFWMKPEDKKALFLEGAKAAIRQLEKFNWSEYYEIRTNSANNPMK
ncbi:patatin-like phospholipase family protein [Ulvibacter antarcticus]|uniref:NTE family protein n=1 Tax=Ulvibacter antarcticus TaxID=442714 RepID=A0A3L9YZ67_9FLAO|nr:patatin-like phospholipase family protein [Ulvibacter antarcticus]RMA64379.1 NTE family protein [Ulvibacter antarcticus]